MCVYCGIESSSLLWQALAAATGRQESLIKKQYDEIGDLGTVASAARAVQRTMFTPTPLTIAGVLKSVLLSLLSCACCMQPVQHFPSMFVSS